MHADGKLTKNDKSVFLDFTSHVISNEKNMVDSNRIMVIDYLKLLLRLWVVPWVLTITY